MSSPHNTLNLPQPLADGLRLRLATPADTEALVEFNVRIHQEDGEPADFLPAWTRVLTSGQHPTTSAADFIVVEDTNTGRIVSATCLIPQTWCYEGIPFGVGRPELVGTDPAYRRRGLTRAIFEKIHALSGAYGHMAQAITGIPWFYRQFGYEYALALGGGHVLPLANVPALPEDSVEPYEVREATEADIPVLVRLYQHFAGDKLVTVPLDEARWRYELSLYRYAARTYCLVNQQGRVVGTYIVPRAIWSSSVILWDLVVDQGVSLRAVLPSAVRAMKTHGESYLAAHGKDGQKLAGIRFSLGVTHPAYQAFGDKLGPYQLPYGWYVRVPDLPGFLRHIAPVLERRLANSVMSGYEGDLKITFYRGGLRLAFEGGRLACAEAWQEPVDGRNWDGAGFPPLVFLQLLFGHRSLAELRATFPDCWADEEPKLLLEALFPKRVSWIAPLA